MPVYRGNQPRARSSFEVTRLAPPHCRLGLAGFGIGQEYPTQHDSGAFISDRYALSQNGGANPLIVGGGGRAWSRDMIEFRGGRRRISGVRDEQASIGIRNPIAPETQRTGAFT